MRGAELRKRARRRGRRLAVAAPAPVAAALLTALAAAGSVVGAAGCVGDVRTSTTPRTAEEQLLVSTAAERAIGAVDASKLAGRRVYVDAELLDSIDRSYVISAFRELCALAGAFLVDTRAEADVAVEVRAAALGATDEHYTLRFPVLYVIGMVPGTAQAPEFLELGYIQHRGWARIQCFAYERRTGAYVFGFRDGWGRAHKAIFEDIYPKASIGDTLLEKVQ